MRVSAWTEKSYFRIKESRYISHKKSYLFSLKLFLEIRYYISTTLVKWHYIALHKMSTQVFNTQKMSWFSFMIAVLVLGYFTKVFTSTLSWYDDVGVHTQSHTRRKGCFPIGSWAITLYFYISTFAVEWILPSFALFSIHLILQ